MLTWGEIQAAPAGTRGTWADLWVGAGHRLQQGTAWQQAKDLEFSWSHRELLRVLPRDDRHSKQHGLVGLSHLDKEETTRGAGGATAERLACPSREPPAPQPGRSSPDCLHTSTLPGMPLTSPDLSSSAPVSFRIAQIESFHYTDNSAPGIHPGFLDGWSRLGKLPGIQAGRLIFTRVRSLVKCGPFSRRGWWEIDGSRYGKDANTSVDRITATSKTLCAGPCADGTALPASTGCCDVDRDSGNGFRHPAQAPSPFFQIGYISPGKPPHQLLMLHTRWPSVRPRPTSPRPAAPRDFST